MELEFAALDKQACLRRERELDAARKEQELLAESELRKREVEVASVEKDYLEKEQEQQKKRLTNQNARVYY